ncbi:MAG: hypothetical protein R3E39_17370 [Anaerolineae bacterium]
MTMPISEAQFIIGKFLRYGHITQSLLLTVIYYVIWPPSVCRMLAVL